MSLHRSVALLALLLGLLAPSLAADTIRLKNGKVITGKITGETFATIEYRRAGVSSTQTVDAADVVEVVYSSTTPEWRDGVKLEAEGEVVKAAEKYNVVTTDDDAPAFLRAAAMANVGDLLLDDNNSVDALTFYEELLGTYPKTRHLARALLGKGLCLFYARRFPEADAVLKQLQADAAAKNLGERWALEAEFLLLWSAEAQGKQGVADGYKALRAKARTDFPGIANKAALRMGRVELANNKVRDAEAMFDEIVSSRMDTDASIVAGAFNGRGRCAFGRAQVLLNEGRKVEALEFFNDALLDFLRVVVSYGGVRKEQAEALYFAGQAFLNVAALDPKAEDAERNGQVLLQRCRERFEGSEWATLAAASR